MSDLSKRRITLVFPPMTMPTSPPLGVAMLKGFVERELPQWQVTVIDLNVWLFRFLLGGIARGEIHLTPAMHERMGADSRVLLQAAQAFTGGNDAAFYEQPQAYDLYGRVFIQFTDVFAEILTAECAEWERTGELSVMLQALVDQVLQTQPEVVGVSMIFSQQLPIGAMLGRFMREQRQMKVFFGGSCFTEGVEHFMRWYPNAADVIVTGDGELPLKALLEQQGNPRGVPGAFYWQGEQVVREAPVFQKNIDAFGAPDFSAVDFSAYYSPRPVAALLLSRGCYWRKCTFCVHYFSAGDSYRLHGLEQVVAMLQTMVAQGVRHFSFVDEMIAPGHFVRLAQAIRAADLDIAYYALSKPNKTFTPEILKEMAASGCKYILWGLESANQRILDLMGKGTQVEEVEQVLRDAHAAGIHNHVYVICGFPTETPQEFADTLRFLERNEACISAIHRSVFSLEQGSPISKDLPKFSIEEVWLRQDTPLGGRMGYRCASGMTMEEAAHNFQAALPFFRRFNPYAQYLANFRDHALLVYDHFSANALAH
jgi:anaerobic magnesium-protoporphyrin IX monomethyl ester cyclase